MSPVQNFPNYPVSPSTRHVQPKQLAFHEGGLVTDPENTSNAIHTPTSMDNSSFDDDDEMNVRDTYRARNSENETEENCTIQTENNP